MTNKEAIEILKEEIEGLPEDNPFYEATSLAINALEKADSQDYEDKRQYSGERTWFDDCHPCTNCQEFECDGCEYDLMHKGNQK